MIMRYKVIKSVRENICLEVGAGRVTVRAPQALRRRDIRAYIKENEDWIRQKLKEYPKGLKGRRLKEEDLDLLTARANEIFSQLVREFSAHLGVRYNAIHIHHKKNKWGRFSSGRNLHFNCLLLMMPCEVLHSVVWHTLCRLKYRFNKAKFKKELARVCPHYETYAQWLKKNGKDFTRRLPKSSQKEDAKAIQPISIAEGQEQPVTTGKKAKMSRAEKRLQKQAQKAAADMIQVAPPTYTTML